MGSVSLSGIHCWASECNVMGLIKMTVIEWFPLVTESCW